jgi:hypothetical protein
MSAVLVSHQTCYEFNLGAGAWTSDTADVPRRGRKDLTQRDSVSPPSLYYRRKTNGKLFSNQRQDRQKRQVPCPDA